MHMLVQHEEPLDLVIGTGESHSVRDFLDIAFGEVNLDWNDYVYIDPAFFRPAEVDYLLADPTKAKQILGWEPIIGFEELVREMVLADLALHGIATS